MKRRTVEVVMADVEVIDALVSEARRDGLILFLHIEDERQELFDRRCWDIISIAALDERLRKSCQSCCGR